MLQELPVKFCAGATFITGFNGSGYSDGTFFLYCLFVRNGGANVTGSFKPSGLFPPALQK